MNGEEISKFSIDFFFYKNGKIKKQAFKKKQAFSFYQKGDHHD